MNQINTPQHPSALVKSHPMTPIVKSAPTINNKTQQWTFGEEEENSNEGFFLPIPLSSLPPPIPSPTSTSTPHQQQYVMHDRNEQSYQCTFNNGQYSEPQYQSQQNDQWFSPQQQSTIATTIHHQPEYSSSSSPSLSISNITALSYTFTGQSPTQQHYSAFHPTTSHHHFPPQTLPMVHISTLPQPPQVPTVNHYQPQQQFWSPPQPNTSKTILSLLQSTKPQQPFVPEPDFDPAYAQMLWCR